MCKVDLIEFVDGLVVGCEGKQQVKDNSTFSCSSS